MLSQPFQIGMELYTSNWFELIWILQQTCRCICVYWHKWQRENVIEWIKLRLLIFWKKIVLNWISFRSRRYGQTANQPANIIDWFLYKKNWCANYKSQRVCVRSKFGRPLCAKPFNSSTIFSSWISFFITNDVSHGPNYLCVFFVQDIIFDRQNDESITHSMITPLWCEDEVVNLFFCQKFASSFRHH